MFRSKPGCARYCEGEPRGDRLDADWAHETLLEHDPGCRCLRYEMNDNNMGFGRFFSMFSVIDLSSPDAGCELRWEFEREPVAGTAKEALAARLLVGLDSMACRVQDAVALEATGNLKLGTSIAV